MTTTITEAAWSATAEALTDPVERSRFDAHLGVSQSRPVKANR